MNPAEKNLKTAHGFKDAVFYNLLFATCYFTALYAIYRHSVTWLVLYVILSFFVGLAVIKFFCAYCPHYRNSGKTVKCMFFWHMPKMISAREGKPDSKDKLITAAAFAVFFLAPVYWLVMSPGLLVIYILSASALLVGIRNYECRRCIYFGCPANNVPGEVRRP